MKNLSDGKFNKGINTSEKIFKDKLNYAVINSITPIITKEEKQMSEGDKNIDYNMSYLDRQFLHYPVILTTHVNLFTYLLEQGERHAFPLFIYAIVLWY